MNLLRGDPTINIETTLIGVNLMAVSKNQRSIVPTTFSWKEVCVVVTALITAGAPLITNDSRLAAIESQQSAIKQQIDLVSSQIQEARFAVTSVSNKSIEDDTKIKSLEIEIKELTNLERKLEKDIAVLQSKK